MKLLAVGFDDAMAKLLSLGEKAKEAYIRGNYLEMEKVATESQRQVPVDTGRLQNSIKFSMTVMKFGARYEIAYRAQYALQVHNNPTMRHENGKWRYLADPFIEAQAGWSKRLQDFINNAVKAGGE